MVVAERNNFSILLNKWPRVAIKTKVGCILNGRNDAVRPYPSSSNAPEYVFSPVFFHPNVKQSPALWKPL